QRRQAARRTAGRCGGRPGRPYRQAEKASVEARPASGQADACGARGRPRTLSHAGIPGRTPADLALAHPLCGGDSSAGAAAAPRRRARDWCCLRGRSRTHAEPDRQRRAPRRAARKLRPDSAAGQGAARQSRPPRCGAALAAAACDRARCGQDVVARPSLSREVGGSGLRGAVERAAAVIVGTAGHIDHGKTTLVHALTGVDTDRLKEEKARGLSIELGYAYKPLDNGEVLGFVDVPGHERLVRTMAAGACGIDFALLVVAADDGVMPQTLEHLAILDLLGISRGAVALTKIDRVDSRRLCQVEAQLGAVLSGTALQGARIFPLNAAADDPDNLHNNRETAAICRHLQESAACTPPHPDDGLFRLAVDRVFTLPGHGHRKSVVS